MREEGKRGQGSGGRKMKGEEGAESGEDEAESGGARGEEETR